ncbi:hypothetical protein SGL43_06794 [Streptomyces globisporus]|uniref:Uncharacterized protein n=1 Tax=Streptomyces globisporus TaxID=1908 RepID=A0ABM9H7V9_STRGL|nr:hypothetical protein SGL43_06794 [Streptomyces globisporus]
MSPCDLRHSEASGGYPDLRRGKGLVIADRSRRSRAGWIAVPGARPMIG